MSMFVEIIEAIDTIFDPQSGRTVVQIENDLRDLERQHGPMLVQKAMVLSHLTLANLLHSVRRGEAA